MSALIGLMIVRADLAIGEQFLSLYVEFQSCRCGDRERIDSAVKHSPYRTGVRRTVVIWQSLLMQETRVSERKPEWKTSMQLGHLSIPSTKHIYFKA